MAHSYFLPILGVGACALGLLLLLGLPSGARPYLPWTVLGIGLAAVGTSVTFHRWHGQLPGRPAVAPTRSATIASPAVPRGPPVETPRPSVLRPVSDLVPHSGIGRAAISAVGRAGDRMWLQWQSHDSGPLGSPLAGPVPETAYVPSRSGVLLPFSYRDRDLVVISTFRPPPAAVETGTGTLSGSVGRSAARSAAGSRSREGRSRSAPYTEEELDALFPPEPALPTPGAALPLSAADGFPIPPSRPAMSVGSEAFRAAGSPPVHGAHSADFVFTLPPPSAAGCATTPDHPSGRFRILPTLLHLHDRLYLEAIHPIPPHLRSSARGRAPADGRTALRPPHCVGCLKDLSGFRGWVMCPGCHQALCRRCLGASFLASSEGFCSRCRPWHGRAAS